MYGFEILNAFRLFVGWDRLPEVEPATECREGDPLCWSGIFDQRDVERSYKGEARPRDPSQVTAIEFHQMGCTLGLSRAQLKAAAGDPRLALRNRVLGMPYHAVGLLVGDVIRNHPVTRTTWHGNGGNAFTIGVGVEGIYPGREKSRAAKHTALERAVLVGRATLVEAVSMLREAGVTGRIKINAHRNFTSGRAADPGEGLWKETALWAVDQLGLEADYAMRRGSGLPIPVDWDPAAQFTWTGKPGGGTHG